MFSYNYNACPLRSGCELTGSGRAGRPGSPPRLEGPLCFPLAGEAERVFCVGGAEKMLPRCKGYVPLFVHLSALVVAE